jgi:hypothetical protein
MTFPFCGARELRSDKQVIYGDAPRYACGTTFGEILGKCCLELQLRAAKAEIARLNRLLAETRAKPLEWEEKLGGKMLEAKSLSGQMLVMIFQRYEPSLVAHIGFETIKRSFANIEAAKAYAEELHQQEWAKLMEWRREI